MTSYSGRAGPAGGFMAAVPMGGPQHVRLLIRHRHVIGHTWP